MNAKIMLDILRENINEATASFWTNAELLEKLNIGQRKMGLKIAMTPGQWLLKSISVTPVASVITLPDDCAKPIYLEETSSGDIITWLQGGVSRRRVSRPSGASLDSAGSGEAYPLMNTLEVNKSSYTTACTLWYQIRVPDLHTGTAQSGSAASTLELDDRTITNGGTGRALVFVDDYYNGAVVELIDSTTEIVDIRSTITDYVASTHKATITGTPTSGDYYGTISRLPEETHSLIVVEATVLALTKPSAALDKDILSMFITERRDLRRDVEMWLESRIPERSGVAIGDVY